MTIPRDRRIRGIPDVAERNLCCGCGACAFVQPDEIRMVDVLDRGRRPIVELDRGEPVDTTAALAVCPGVGLERPPTGDRAVVPELLDDWGPVLAVWEGHAADPDLRRAGSSGGAASAVAMHCIEHEGMHGVLHTAARDDVPFLNRTVLSRTRDEVLAATGSRYAPASPCDGLDRVESAPSPCVFVGKPCDVAAVQRVRGDRPRLDERLGLVVAFFCAGTPSTAGTLEMLELMGVSDLARVREVRYRGNGWPGRATVVTDDDATPPSLSYEESWGEILQRHRQWRCYVCADHGGEFADVSVADPWYRELGPDEVGESLVIARTDRGLRIVERAIASGALALERVDPGLLPASQPNLLRAHGATWARAAACRTVGVPAPRYRGFGGRAIWRREFSATEKVRSFLGTWKRVVVKRLHRRTPVQETTRWQPPRR